MFGNKPMVQSGKILILVGIGLVTIGGLFYYYGDKLSWLGKLPGDFRVEKPNLKLYFPLTTMLILSLFLNIAFRIIKWFLH